MRCSIVGCKEKATHCLECVGFWYCKPHFTALLHYLKDAFNHPKAQRKVNKLLLELQKSEVRIDDKQIRPRGHR